MTLLEAQSNLIKAQAEYIQCLERTGVPPEPIQKDSSAPLYRDYALQFLKSKKQFVTSATYSNYAYSLEKRILPIIGDKKINEIDKKTIQDFVNKYASQYSPHTVKDLAMLAKSVLIDAYDNNVLSSMPQFKLKYPKAENKDYHILTNEEYMRLRDYITNKERNKGLASAVLVGMETGARIGEICGLQWKDVDFANNTISINKSVKRIYTSDGSFLEIGKPKTPNAYRSVIMSKILRNFLEQNQKKTEAFIATAKEAYTEPRTLRQGFSRLLARAGVSSVNFHALRHGFITRCIEKGADPKSVASLVGHKNCDITLNIYTNITQKMKENTIELLEKEFPDKEKKNGKR